MIGVLFKVEGGSIVEPYKNNKPQINLGDWSENLNFNNYNISGPSAPLITSPQNLLQE